MVFYTFHWFFDVWGYLGLKNHENCAKETKRAENEAKRGKRGEKEATREAQRRPKRSQGAPKVVRGTSTGIQRDYIFGPGASLRIKDPWKSSHAGCWLQNADWKDCCRGSNTPWGRRISIIILKEIHMSEWRGSCHELKRATIFF